MIGQRFPIVEARGSALEMGRQHGEQAAGLIQRYLLLIERITGLSRDVLCQNAMLFLPRLQALSASLVEEVRGLAEGAEISFEEAILCQVRGEAAHNQEGGCTAFALRGAATIDGNLLVGQNQDMTPEFEEVSILLRLMPSDGRPRALVYTFAGQLGYFGMNQFGVVNYANSLYDYRWQPGLAHYPLKRMVLEQPNVGACIALFRQNTVCSAANTLLADGQGQVANLEIRPEGLAIYPGEHPDAIIHTNHYLTREFEALETGSLPDSFTRHKRMSELVRQNWGRISVETVQSMLADHEGDPAAICRHGMGGMHTTSGHIAEPQKGLLHIRRGHGCLGWWETYQV